MSWSIDGKKVAVLVGDNVHLFDAASKNHESAFAIRGDKGLTNDRIGVHYVGDTIFVEGADQGPYAAVWQLKSDGTAVGPLVGIGGKDPLSTYHGSFSVLDPDHVGVAERGMETLTSFEVSTGKRAKAVRKIGKLGVQRRRGRRRSGTTATRSPTSAKTRSRRSTARSWARPRSWARRAWS